MKDSPPSGSPSTFERPLADRLDSWKEIAAYLARDVTTVQRWEKREGMPVHRHRHQKAGSVYAFREELDAWARGRSAEVGPPAGDAQVVRMPSAAEPGAPRHGAGAWLLVAAGAVLMVVLGARVLRRPAAPENPLANARFVQLTDLDGVEQAAAISRDGRFVAFQSDRDGRMDVWITQVGTDRSWSVTGGAAPELVNPAVRTLGFSPDGDLVTFWARGERSSSQGEIGIWSAPLLGGPRRAYLEGVAEHDWSADGRRLVYHTPGPGDPMYVRDEGSSAPRRIFSAPAGLHAHFPLWSRDGRSVYFVQGALPDRLDLWRVPASGGAPERLTHHDALVSHPVVLDARTLLYLSAEPDGTGPFIHALDVERRVSRRVSLGIDGYTSLSASADGRRVVATVATPRRTLWQMRLDGAAAPARIPLATGNGSSPRLGPGFLIHVASSGAGDVLWKLQAGGARELWRAPEARIVGAPAIRRDGSDVAFVVRRGGRTSLEVVDPDGGGARTLADGLDLRGAPAWSPDGQSLTVAARVDGVPRLFRVPRDGRRPEPFVSEHSVDPAWSPRGDVVAFSGADVGTTFPVRTVTADGTGVPTPAVTLTRGARHLAFLPDGRSLVVLRGDLRHKDLWRIDLDTGAERRLTQLPADFEVADFDLSPDGRELVLERVQERSDLVLIELPRR